MLGLSPQRRLRFNFRPCRKEGLEADEESKRARALSIGIYECEHFAEYAITLRHVHRARLHNDIIADLECWVGLTQVRFDSEHLRTFVAKWDMS